MAVPVVTCALAEIDLRLAGFAPYFVYRSDRLALDEPSSGLVRAYRRVAGEIADRAARLRLVQLVHAALRGRTQRTEQQAQQRRLAALGVPDPVAMPCLSPTHPGLAEAWPVTAAQDPGRPSLRRSRRSVSSAKGSARRPAGPHGPGR